MVDANISFRSPTSATENLKQSLFDNQGLPTTNQNLEFVRICENLGPWIAHASGIFCTRDYNLGSRDHGPSTLLGFPIVSILRSFRKNRL
ncbi:hypothetical protein AG1IA_06341 [Rhizoctonia solani AG-1 IA]|uniref:Uncharacterized protein n=1 Tax=Thanatephorus cucumeris (strain AG1-IA) TaxID=983506 RepID=L8WS51_THACA|nr:hypothetical protein AG1IA_06341 [Rhizoctonia solani AG-1 IA]